MFTKCIKREIGCDKMKKEAYSALEIEICKFEDIIVTSAIGEIVPGGAGAPGGSAIEVGGEPDNW